MRWRVVEVAWAAVATTLAAPAAAWAGGEPDDPGPFEVEVGSYDSGDESYGIDDFPIFVEFRAAVYSPVALDQGPFPLVLILHGRHSTCYNPANPMGVPGDGSFNGGFLEWPCGPGRAPIPSFEGYDSAAQLLASHGYIVVSVSANGISAADNGQRDGGANARAQLMVAHLNAWAQFNATDAEPFGSKFVGAVDIDRIGLVGHSRGGDGVASTVLLDQELGSPIGIDAALMLAPVDLNRAALNGVALGVLLPYCDGDVVDLQGAHYFDDARYTVPGDLAAKYAYVLHGANHNYFNRIWSPSTFVAGAVDDFGELALFLEGVDPDCSALPGSGRISEAAQRAVLTAYMSAFFRRHLGDDDRFDDLLRGNATAAAASAPIYATYLAPDDRSERLDVNHLDTAESLLVNALGEPVSAEALQPYELCGLEDRNAIVDSCMNAPDPLFEAREPHTPGLGQLRIAFEPGARWVNALPAGTDVSELQYLQFRAAVDFEGPARVASGVDVTVELTDGSGQSASLVARDYSDALDAPRGTLAPVLPKKILSAVRLPLEDFVGIDRADIASIALIFDGAPGALLLSDLAFSDAPPEVPEGTGTGTGTTGEEGGSDEVADDQNDGIEGTGSPSVTSGASDETGDADGAADEAGGCGCRHRDDGMPTAASMLAALLLLGSRLRRGPRACLRPLARRRRVGGRSRRRSHGRRGRPSRRATCRGPARRKPSRLSCSWVRDRG